MKPTPAAFRWPADATPRLQTAGLFFLDDRHFDYCYRSDTHALHLHEYRGTFRIADRQYPLTPGTLTCTPAGQPSWYDLPQPGQHWCIHFQPAETPTGRLYLSLPLVMPLGPARAETLDRMARITHIWARTTSSDRLAARAAAVATHDLLLYLAMLTQPDAPLPGVPDPIQQVLHLISTRLHRPLRTSDLAARVGWSHNYLARRFRQRTGMTIDEYLLQTRVERARLLLRTTDLPVKQIGARVGMPDPQYFNKQMRRVCGASPSALRRAPRHTAAPSQKKRRGRDSNPG